MARAVVFASGAPATLVETVPWMRGPQADAVRASIAAHDPAAGAVGLPTPTSVLNATPAAPAAEVLVAAAEKKDDEL